MTRRADDQDSIWLLAGEQTLGLLPADRSLALEAEAHGNAALSGAIAFWRDRLLAFDDSAPTLAPPARLWARVERSLGLASPVTGRARPARRLADAWQSLGFWRGLGGALAAAAVVLLVLLLSPAPPASQPVAVALLVAPEGGGTGAVVEAYADGSIDLLPVVAIPVPEGSVLQVWTLWDRDRGPVPLGTLAAARSVHLAGAGLPLPVADQLYEITLEPSGGSPTGRPTGPVLYKGLALALPR